MTILFEVEGFTRKIYKVKGSQDDDFVGVFCGRFDEKHPKRGYGRLF